jgi:hypothetical protein
LEASAAGGTAAHEMPAIRAEGFMADGYPREGGPAQLQA